MLMNVGVRAGKLEAAVPESERWHGDRPAARQAVREGRRFAG
jgi:hypothetical protein